MKASGGNRGIQVEVISKIIIVKLLFLYRLTVVIVAQVFKMTSNYQALIVNLSYRKYVCQQNKAGVRYYKSVWNQRRKH
jgi:TM2 domain-containing membrane protein YozV